MPRSAAVGAVPVSMFVQRLQYRVPTALSSCVRVTGRGSTSGRPRRVHEDFPSLHALARTMVVRLAARSVLRQGE